MTTKEPPGAPPLGVNPDKPIPITLLMPHPTAPSHMFNVTVWVPARLFTSMLFTPQLETDLNQYVEDMGQAAEALIQLAQAAIRSMTPTPPDVSAVILQAKNGKTP